MKLSQQLRQCVWLISTIHMDYPVTEWGASVSEVQKLHKGGSADKESDELISYAIMSGTKYKYLYGYLFENGKLKGATLLVPSTDTEKLVPWLKQKYSLQMTGDDTIFSGGYDAYEINDSYTVLGVTLQSMNTSKYSSSYAYLIAWVPGKRSSTRAADTSASDVTEWALGCLRENGLIE